MSVASKSEAPHAPPGLPGPPPAERLPAEPMPAEPGAPRAPAAPKAYAMRRSAARLIREDLDKNPASPLSAMIEVADRCNEACEHCYQVQGEKGEMTTAQVKRVMDELRELGVLFLIISGGEPTLRKDFLELVEYARRSKFAVKVFSNGLRITEAMAQRLAELAVQEVQISLYSPDPQAHDSVTRVRGSFEATVAAVRRLTAVGVRVVVKSPLMTVNQADADRYVELVRSLGADFSLDPLLNPRENGDSSPLSLSVGKERYLALRRSPAFAKQSKDHRTAALGTSPCKACRGNVHIEANGELRPCTQWSVATGNALEEGVVQAFRHDPRARAIRELTWADMWGCRQCDLRDECGRCFSDAKLGVGDALAPYAEACRHARWTYELRHRVEPSIAPNEAGSTEVGPYRSTGEHRFEAFVARPTERDEALARQLPFLRAEAPAGRTGGAAPGQLVQLRRAPAARVTLPAAAPSNTAERLGHSETSPEES